LQAAIRFSRPREALTGPEDDSYRAAELVTARLTDGVRFDAPEYPEFLSYTAGG
jgi:hypothetical protein